MTIILRGLARAIGQLNDPVFRNVVVAGIIGAIFVFILLWYATAALIGAVAWSELPLIGWIFGSVATVLGWAESVLGSWLGDWVSAILDLTFISVMFSVSFLLFPAVTTLIVGLFLDKIAAAVEARHYTGRPPPRYQSLPETIGESLKFLLVTIGVNILALPIYAILFFIPPLNLIFYYTLNGYLIGREFYEMVALRRLSPETALLLRRRCRFLLIVAGGIIMLGMTIPFVNLLAPVLAAAMMVHIFESVRAREGVPLENGNPAKSSGNPTGNPAGNPAGPSGPPAIQDADDGKGPPTHA